MGVKASKFSFWLSMIAGGVMVLWGVLHLIPTVSVVDGLGVYEPDSVTIITMEWVVGGLTPIFLGVLLIFLAPYLGMGNPLARGVVLLVVLMLAVMAIWSGVTGARTGESVFFKICPFVESLAALLALLAAWFRVGTRK